MRSKFKIVTLVFILLAIVLVPSCFAATVLESSENYTEGAIIYGSTRFEMDQVITAGVAFNAGINESKVWVALGNKLNDLEPVTPYYYDGASWYKITTSSVEIVEDKDVEEIEENLHIFFVNNEVKTIEVPFDGTVDKGSVTEGVSYNSNAKKFDVPAYIFDFEFTSEGAEVKVETNVDTNKIEGNTEEDIKEPEIINPYVASIGNEFYDDLTKAVVAAKEGVTVKLLKDVDLPTAIKVDTKFTLNLNGKKITAKNDPNGDGIFKIVAGGDLTIEGEGTIDAACLTNDYSMAVWVTETGKLTINGGTFTNLGAKAMEDDGKTPNNNEVIQVRDSGAVVINGGTFIGNTSNKVKGAGFTLNLRDQNRETATIVVKGGTFTEFNPANNAAEGEGTNFVADGYKVIADGDKYTVVAYDANNVASEAELRYFIAKGGTIKLASDIKISTNKSLSLSKDLVLDLNGYKISVFEGYTKNNVINTCAKLTIKGNGTIDTRRNDHEYSYAIYAWDGGNVTIENGNFIGIHGLENYPCTLIYCQGEGSVVIILDGTFVGDAVYTLNLTDADYDNGIANIIVKGGTYTGFNPANNLAEGEGTNFVADGYRAVYNEATKTYTVKSYDINNVDDDDSLKYALAHAKEGATINLAAGNYSKVLIDYRKNVAKNITLLGTEGVNIAGVNMNGGNFGFVPEGLTFKNITFTGDVNVNNTDKFGVICKNLSLIECTFSNAAFTAGSNSTIEGLTIKNNKFNGTNTTNKTSILLQGENHTNVLIEGNTIDGSVHNAVQLAISFSGKATIYGNTIKNTGSRAIRISTGEGAELNISNNIISNANTNPTEAEENKGEVVKITGIVTSPTAEGNTYNGKALTFIDGIAASTVEE